MSYKNLELYDFAESFLGQGGAVFRKYCGLGKNDPYCDAFVTYILHKKGCGSLYCNGTKQINCQTSINWCYKNLANIPIYLALPMDIIFFDWNLNMQPNHVGFVRKRKSDQEILTIEGNTSQVNDKGKTVKSGVVANRTRTVKYVQAVFRPHYPVSFKTGELEVDGLFGYSSIAMWQKAMGRTPTGIITIADVKAFQKLIGATQDGSWGNGTSKKAQEFLKKAGCYNGDIDGYFGSQSVKALQKWINAKLFPKKATTTKPVQTPAKAPAVTKPATPKVTPQDKMIAEADKLIANKFKYVFYSKNKNYPKNGGNCIRFWALCVQAAYKSISSKQDGMLDDAFANKLLRSTGKVALELWCDRNGKGKWKLISNNGKPIPMDKFQKGDTLLCYSSKKKYKHTAGYAGNGKIVDCTSSKGASKRNYSDLSYKCYLAFRYIGK